MGKSVHLFRSTYGIQVSIATFSRSNDEPGMWKDGQSRPSHRCEPDGEGRFANTLARMHSFIIWAIARFA